MGKLKPGIAPGLPAKPGGGSSASPADAWKSGLLVWLLVDHVNGCFLGGRTAAVDP
jgi:hypothetical protein